MAKPHPEPPAPAKPQLNSPLPPPAALAAYEQALPGAADRIITMAELDQKAEIRDIWFERRARFIIDLVGQLFLYALVLGAVYLAARDTPLAAFFAGLAPIVIAIYANTRKKSPDANDETN